jgi:hypothetical protein
MRDGMGHIEIASLAGIAHVERLVGARGDPEAPPDLLVEVPHGADRRAHYDALRARLVGDLPADLHIFFHVNTDVGAWDYGRHVAEQLVAARPTRTALLVRCLIPRTFIDANRLEDAPDDLARSGLTAAVAPYVRHPQDLALLLSLHRAYVRLIERAYEAVCEQGGFALSPHTYGPRTIGIAKIDDEIVHALRRAHEPDQWENWPLRPEVDLITCAADGTRYAPEQVCRRITEGYRAIGLGCVECGTYTLHPATQGMRWAVRWPDRFLSLEIRRDLLVESYTPFEEMRIRPEAVARLSQPIVAAIDEWLAERGR